jgi:serine/threonine protein kinase
MASKNSTNSRPIGNDEQDPSVALVKERVFLEDPEYQTYFREHDEQTNPYVDFMFSAKPWAPREAFERLRWGGQFVFASRDRNEVQKLFRQYQSMGEFEVETEPSAVSKSMLGLPFFKRQVWYFVARKVSLIHLGEPNERFSYHVELVRRPAPAKGYMVLKAVPSVEEVVLRFRKRFPNMAEQDLAERAKKFTEKVFPVFLTREAGIMQILRRDMPEQFAKRVPRLYGVKKDKTGFVKELQMEWLRLGGKPMDQLEFAKQSAQMLKCLHENAKVMHLDLRLDNVVITPDGVGVIDFGSAVRFSEDFSKSKLLTQLFEEMMQTSQIQRMLGKMGEIGALTRRSMLDAHHKVDKAVDIFYLVVQMNKPHSNPDFRGLVEWDPNSQQAKVIQALTDYILKPPDPNNNEYNTARDVYEGVLKVERHLKTGEPLQFEVGGPSQSVKQWERLASGDQPDIEGLDVHSGLEGGLED